MKSINLVVFLIGLLLGSCVTPYDITPGYKESIVIEGIITDQPGPYVVKVSRLIPVNEQLQDRGLLSGAIVILRDDIGNSETLVEKSKGNYYSNSFQGVVGRSYSISVSVGDGNTYQSSLEKMLPVGDFSLRHEFKLNEDPDNNFQLTSKNGFNIYLSSEVLPEQEERVWWRWTGTFHIWTFPQNRTKWISGFKGVAVEVPDPPVCAFNWPSGACTCCDCWVNQYNTKPLLSNERFINNGYIGDLKIGFIEVNRRTFCDKYYLEVEQLSVSAAVYNFWKSVKIGMDNSSDLFQTPPPKTVGNIYATSKNALPVIGYFAASSSKKHFITLDRSNVPYTIWPMDIIPDDCRTVYRNISNQKPAFW